MGICYDEIHRWDGWEAKTKPEDRAELLESQANLLSMMPEKTHSPKIIERNRRIRAKKITPKIAETVQQLDVLRKEGKVNEWWVLWHKENRRLRKYKGNCKHLTTKPFCELVNYGTGETSGDECIQCGAKRIQSQKIL